jgi:hypothetical protein
VAGLFPKGFGKVEGRERFDWLVTTGLMRNGKLRGMEDTTAEEIAQMREVFGIRGDGPMHLLAPQEGAGLAVISLPFDHPKLDEQIIHDLVRLYTQVAPHPEAGPEERRKRANLKINFNTPKPILGLDEYDAFVAGWAGLVFANNATERGRQLYEKVVDMFGYMGDGDDQSRPIDQLLYTHKNTDFADKWTGMAGASATDAYFFTAVAAPLMALMVEKALDEAGAKDLLRDLIIKVNKGEVVHLEKALADVLSADEAARLLKVSSLRIPNRSADNLSLFMAPAMKRGYVDGVHPRPQNERLDSMGGQLDIRLYMRDPQNPARTAFVLTHGTTTRSISRYTRSYDLASMPTIKRLLPHGDVLVVHRFSYGETDAVPSEFLNTDCANPRYLWGIRSADQHLVNAFAWLRAGGYNRIIALANNAGALPLLSAAASDGQVDQIVLFDPWRRIGTFVCRPDELTQILQGYMAKIKAPVHVVNRRWSALYGGHGGPDMEKRMNTLFKDITWLPAAKRPEWALNWNTMEQYPDLWWPEVEKRLKK